MTWKQWLKLTMFCETIWPKLFWIHAQKNICRIVKVLWHFYICVWPFPKSQIWTWCPWKLWYLQIFLWAQASVYEVKDYLECTVGRAGRFFLENAWPNWHPWQLWNLNSCYTPGPLLLQFFRSGKNLQKPNPQHSGH